MNIIKLFNLFYLVNANHFIKLPTRRWKQIYKSSNYTAWNHNKSERLRLHLRENLDIFYI